MRANANFIAVLGFGLAAVLLPVRDAAANCKLDAIVTSYKVALADIKSGKADGAMRFLAPMAEAGLGPAQRELAKAYAAGMVKDDTGLGAAFWAELAFRAGDKEGRRLSRKYRAALSDDARAKLTDALPQWLPKRLTCKAGRVARAEGQKGPHPIPDIRITFDKRINDQDKDDLQQKADRLLEQLVAADPADIVYLSAIDVLEIYKGSRYHRYAGWRAQNDINVLRMAGSNFEDKSPKFVVQMVILEAKRRLYAKLPSSSFADPYVRKYAGQLIYGSVYPDVRNGKFFSVIRHAFDMAKRLPKELQQYIDVIDEVHYNTSSKHFIRAGIIDSSGAYYNKLLSDDGKRMMFVRRDVRYSSALFFLRTFVHEGTHAVQDKRAREYVKDVNRIKRAQVKLERSGQAESAKAKALEKEINEKLDYAKRWFQGIKTATGRVQDIAFECEATRNEILAVKALDGPPDVMQSSGYLKLCPKAQQIILDWERERRRANRR
jgi:hypothetical protein